jgi:hypothetical protein
MVGVMNSTPNGYPLLTFGDGDFNCEEPQYLLRQYDFNMPAQEKNLKRVSVRYEDLGGAIVACNASTTRTAGQLSQSGNVTLGGTGDGRIRRGYFDLDISGEIIGIYINRSGGSGPLSITDMLMFVEPRGEVVENI